MKAYCVKHRKMMDMVGGKRVKLKNGRFAMKGKCKGCGTGLFKFVGS